jgi:hypothetical protein
MFLGGRMGWHAFCYIAGECARGRKEQGFPSAGKRLWLTWDGNDANRNRKATLRARVCGGG